MLQYVFQSGAVARTELSGLPCVVEELLGIGGQGEVYRARLGDAPVALKWYFPSSATPAQQRRLRVLINRGSPATTFLWPIELVTATGIEGFGYIMPLRALRFRDPREFLVGRLDLPFSVLARVGFGLADSFYQLHINGLCYHDINFGNVFADPATGDVCICDTDNVGVNGEPAGVLGTVTFMAPEIIRRQAYPTVQTDHHSLAVLLFYLFMRQHPLKGRRETAIDCWDAEADAQFYGTDPLFIFDPDNDANRPVPGVHDAPLALWPRYPGFLRDAFTRTFTRGLRDPGGRVGEAVWRRTMARLIDAVMVCPICGAETFSGGDARSASDSPPSPCWRCGKSFSPPPRLQTRDDLIVLNPGTQLFPHHVDSARRYDFSRPVARVTRHPAQPDRLGLTNLSDAPWGITESHGGAERVDPGRTISLETGARIAFGTVDGKLLV